MRTNRYQQLQWAVTNIAVALPVMGSSPAIAQIAEQEVVQQTTGAGAMPEPADSLGIGEIVVTAQRRAESVQKTALAIEVLSGDDVLNSGVTTPSDLTTVVTGIQASGGGTNQIYVRGVGDYGVLVGANPAVVTNLNGIPISRSQAIGGNFFDLERVEILKGPQGTLYGRNASGGVINLIAVRPKMNDVSGYAFASYGNYDALHLEGALNVPIGSTAAARLSAQVVDRDGYLSDGTDDDKHQTVRLQVLQESGPLTALLRVGYQRIDGTGPGFALLPPIPGESAWTGAASRVASDYLISLAAANFAASGGTSLPPALLARLDSLDFFQRLDSATVDAQFDYEFDGATLTVIPAYRWVHSRFTLPPTYYYGNGAGETDGDRSDQYSLEARLGNSGEKLKWVAGVFGLKEDVSSDYLVDWGEVQRIRITSPQATKSFAVFGEATYSVTDDLRFTLGARWTVDKRESGNFEYVAVSPTFAGRPPCLPANGFPPGTECNALPPGGSYNSSKTFKRATWRVGAEYDITPRNMLFANVAKGFKAGGFNIAVDPQQTSQLLAFKPETITAYTLGLRNRFANDSIQVNIEGFYWDYKDLQLTQLIFDGVGNITVATQNAGKAPIYGFNVDVIVKPFRGTTLRAAVEYLDAKYQTYQYSQIAALTPPGSLGCPVTASSVPAGPLGPFVDINCSGFPLTRAPEWSGNLGASKVFDLADRGNVTLDGDMTFATKRYVSDTFTRQSLDGGYVIVSASLTYNGPDNKWSVGGFIRNITNTAAFVGGGEQSPYVPQFIATGILPPRTYGVNVRRSF